MAGDSPHDRVSLWRHRGTVPASFTRGTVPASFKGDSPRKFPQVSKGDSPRKFHFQFLDILRRAKQAEAEAFEET